ncbi:hypothetical protein KSP40_PGU011799 [Platanthera guangdongensis]|uniref:Methyltransferase small domain-containing protein n=1 Tax=Platanthera guangdongensis TaxID=2320717 RepID=A0ABR2MW97_9ASPA
MGLLLRPPVLVTARAASRHPPSRSPKVEAKAVTAPSSRPLDRQKPSIDLESASSSSSTVTTALQCQHFQSCSGCSQEWELDRPHMAAVARKFFQDLGVSDFSFESGMLFAVTTYNSSLPAAERYTNGKVQVSLVWNSVCEQSESFDKLNSLAKFLWRNGGPRSNSHLFHSIWVNFQTSSINTIFGSRWKHLLGERDFWEHIGGIDICLDPSSFGQANTQAFNSLLRKLHKYVPYGSSVVDLYSGAGVIGLSVAATRKCRSLRCVEINKESKLSFEKSLGRLSKHIDCDIHWHNTDASIEPLHWLKGSNVVIVDPPKKGLGQSLLDALREISNYKDSNVPKSSIIKEKEEKRPWMLRARASTVHMEGNINWEKAQIWPEFLIYVSCGWESFEKDCLYLLSNNAWHLEKAHAFNFFPGTESLEILAVFKRGPRVSQTKKKSGKKKPQVFKP